MRYYKDIHLGQLTKDEVKRLLVFYKKRDHVTKQNGRKS